MNDPAVSRAIWSAVVAPSRRGMDEFEPAVGIDAYARAAGELVAGDRPVIVATGFPVGGAPETDGPPGAFAIADALRALGRTVTIASYPAALAIFGSVRPDHAYTAIPVGRDGSRDRSASDLVTIEICGMAADGRYRNMHGKDITGEVPWIEAVFGLRALVSIGDGGNEFGMGAAPAGFFRDWGVAPPVSTAQHLLPATTSNYGAYALIRECERASALKLLPDPDREEQLIRDLVAAGCVDGFSGEAVARVDGLASVETARILRSLREIG